MHLGEAIDVALYDFEGHTMQMVSHALINRWSLRISLKGPHDLKWGFLIISKKIQAESVTPPKSEPLDIFCPAYKPQ